MINVVKLGCLEPLIIKLSLRLADAAIEAADNKRILWMKVMWIDSHPDGGIINDDLFKFCISAGIHG